MDGRDSESELTQVGSQAKSRTGQVAAPADVSLSKSAVLMVTAACLRVLRPRLRSLFGRRLCSLLIKLTCRM